LQCLGNYRFNVASKEITLQLSEYMVSRDQANDSAPYLHLPRFVEDDNGWVSSGNAKSLNNIISEAEKIGKFCARSRNTGTTKKDHAAFVAGSQ